MLRPDVQVLEQKEPGLLALRLQELPVWLLPSSWQLASSLLPAF
jgi:hypothetical protein